MYIRIHMYSLIYMHIYIYMYIYIYMQNSPAREESWILRGISHAVASAHEPKTFQKARAKMLNGQF